MKRILYIEDSITSQRIFQRMFNPPHDVVLVASLKLAEAYLERHAVNLVVSDYLLPGCDAFAVLQSVRRLQPTAPVPFVVVSSSMDGELTDRLLTAGATACAAKPLQNADFRALIEGLLGQGDGAASAEPSIKATCFQWFEKGHFHEFCPETGDHVTAPSREELVDRMQALLQERWTRGVPFGHVSHAQARTYVLRHETVLAD